MGVCQSLRWEIFQPQGKNHSVNFTKFSIHVTCGCGSVLLCRWQWDTLCTSGVVDDVVFSDNAGIGQNRRQHVCFVQFAWWRHREQSLPSPTASCWSSHQRSQHTGQRCSCYLRPCQCIITVRKIAYEKGLQQSTFQSPPNLFNFWNVFFYFRGPPILACRLM